MKPAHKLASVETLIRYATDGIENANWYVNGYEEILAVCKIEKWKVEQFAHILAILSPRVSVVRNIRNTLHYFGTGMVFNNTLPTIRKALQVYNDSGVIGGHKVPQFARAVLGDTSAIVLDTWMAKVFFPYEPNSGLSSMQFRRKATMAEACRRITIAGEKLGLAPRDCQACIWQGIILENKATASELSVWSVYKNWIEVYSRDFPVSGSIDRNDYPEYEDTGF